ncbi:unnamed protein product [Ectocarpus sp. 12 AP-2014]
MEDVYTRRATPGCVKEGYLFKKSSSKMLQHWNRRWFVLDGSKLYYLKNDSSRQKMLICDVMLCTVKEVHSSDALYCFEVFSANRRSYMLQAEGPDELTSWVTCIRRTIESQLTGSTPLPGDDGGGGTPTGRFNSGTGTSYVDDTSDEEGYRSLANGGTAARGADAGSPPNNPLVQEVMKANPECADCGAPNPDWVSLNLGVLVCIQCSGIHRSLGTHVSKVRSLGLDALDEIDLSVLREVGNARSNAIWEHSLAQREGWEKPTANSPGDLKRSYIQAKYVWKGFVEGSTSRLVAGGGWGATRGGGGDHSSSEGGGGGSSTHSRRSSRDGGGVNGDSTGGSGGFAARGGGAEMWSLRLSECAASGDLAGAVEALAHGGDPRWTNPEDQHRTALHCAAATGDLGCCEFLIQNGADVLSLDERQCSPLDIACLGNKVPAVEYFSDKMDR